MKTLLKSAVLALSLLACMACEKERDFEWEDYDWSMDPSLAQGSITRFNYLNLSLIMSVEAGFNYEDMPYGGKFHKAFVEVDDSVTFIVDKSSGKFLMRGLKRGHTYHFDLLLQDPDGFLPAVYDQDSFRCY